MINTNELRRGNWIKRIDGGAFVVEDITDNCVNIELGEYEMTGWYHDEDELEGIPLTEEILLACGFEKIQESSMAYPEVWRITSIRILVPYHFELSTRGEGEYRWFEGNANVPVYYLHSLMNLYYQITGTELVYTVK